ncbi:carbamoylphosphate synthase large subunit [Streptomyces sp. NBC_01092]|uniref:preATP grasp domain-containing protein n=1 Tax=Streptomyces sp. NBC_01092 TaxID=2903748 RepID=UPI0038681BA5|nr:ATP-grasp domain-containing protein [Streptomyces sp. NBC_01092]
MTFSRRLKRALTGDSEARFVYLGNFEVERDWARGEPRLPGAGVNFTAATVNRMEEMGVFLADDDDVLLLKEPPDPQYRTYLHGLGVASATVLCPENTDPLRRITEDALESPQLIADLRALADGRTHLLPLGVSPALQVLAEQTGIRLAAPSAAVCKAVNGKIFSRMVTERVGLREVPGECCRTYGDVADAVDRHLGASERVVVKESFGVSGRGMVVLDRRSADTFLRMIGRRGRDAPADMVVETWMDEVESLNYQFIVARDGSVLFETVKAAITESGVHRGHRFPTRLPDGIETELRRSAELLGRELYDHGYFGMVGVDALLSTDGLLYPCLEINARFNMANYQNCIADLCVPPGAHAQACSIELTMDSTLSFTEFTRPFEELLLDRAAGKGIVVSNFATVNAGAAAEADRFRGRLGVMCVAGTAAEAAALRHELDQRLATGLVGTGQVGVAAEGVGR